MNVLVSGARGFVGAALVPALEAGGHQVTRLVRRPARGSNEVSWDPEAGRLEETLLEGTDAVVHLAGENIASGRWNDARKARIRNSRVVGTRLLTERLARLREPPRVLVCASATGYYGSRGDEVLDETSRAGTGFLADLVKDWESATGAVKDRGVRVIHLRLGMILGRAGGALPRMLLPFRLGAGGRLGSGKQYWSWVAIEDVVHAIKHVLAAQNLAGAVNLVSPEPITNAEFTKVLGRVLRRPTIFPVPEFAARLAFGELADALFFASQRVTPRRLVESGYVFRFPNLEGALRHALSSPTGRS